MHNKIIVLLLRIFPFWNIVCEYPVVITIHVSELHYSLQVAVELKQNGINFYYFKKFSTLSIVMLILETLFCNCNQFKKEKNCFK